MKDMTKAQLLEIIKDQKTALEGRANQIEILVKEKNHWRDECNTATRSSTELRIKLDQTNKTLNSKVQIINALGDTLEKLGGVIAHI